MVSINSSHFDLHNIGKPVFVNLIISLYKIKYPPKLRKTAFLT